MAVPRNRTLLTRTIDSAIGDYMTGHGSPAPDGLARHIAAAVERAFAMQPRPAITVGARK